MPERVHKEEWRCEACGKLFDTEFEAEQHEEKLCDGMLQ